MTKAATPPPKDQPKNASVERADRMLRLAMDERGDEHTRRTAAVMFLREISALGISADGLMGGVRAWANKHGQAREPETIRVNANDGFWRSPASEDLVADWLRVFAGRSHFCRNSGKGWEDFLRDERTAKDERAAKMDKQGQRPV